MESLAVGYCDIILCETPDCAKNQLISNYGVETLVFICAVGVCNRYVTERVVCYQSFVEADYTIIIIFRKMIKTLKK